MPIALPNLDDKTFDGLVADATAQIPALYPAWTDYNPSDPGITLIELFAWLVEMVIYRNNRITAATYQTFLGLLVGPTAAPALQNLDIDDAIRQTVLGLRQIYRAATVQDYQSLTTGVWPGSPEAAALAASLQALVPPLPMPNIKRVVCVGQYNIGPAAATEVGARAVFSAVATLSDGTTEDVTSVASWASSASSIATVAAGTATGVLAGAAQITASLGAVSGQATLTVGSGTLASIALTPSAPTAAVGRAFPFVATGTYSDGASADVTLAAAWSSTATSVLTIDATGHAVAVAAGQTTVAAQVGSVTAETLVTVSSAALSSISVTPALTTHAIGDLQQLVAVGHYADGTVADLTAGVTWASGTPTVAFVSSASGSAGLMTAARGGLATVTATLGAVSGSASVTVSAADLLSLAVTPTSPSIPVPATVALTVAGAYSDGTTADLTAQAIWSSSASSVASVSSGAGSPGVVTAAGAGSATVTATVGTASATAAITVTSATLVSIAIAPSSPSVPVSVTLALTAEGTYSDGTLADLTAAVVWSTASASIATIAGGVATGVGAGSTAVYAVLGSVTGSSTLTVTSATLSSIAVTPATPTVLLGASQQMAATGTFSDGSTFDVTGLVSWTTGAVGVATESNASGSQGVVTATGVGQTSVIATEGSITGSTLLTVPSLLAIVVSPIDATQAGGDSVPFSATAIFTDNSTQDVTALATWTSSLPSVATIGAPGVVVTVAPGSTTIAATYGGLSGSTPLTVSGATVTAISVIADGAPLYAPGHVSLIVAPDSGAGTNPWLMPSPSLTSALGGFFDPRRLLTTHVHVTGPIYVPVTIAATLYLEDDADPDTVNSLAVTALLTRFDPWQGGTDGTGWPFGRTLHASEVYAVLAPLSGVQYLDSVVVSGGAPPSDAEHVVTWPHQLVEVQASSILLTLMEQNGTEWAPVSL